MSIVNQGHRGLTQIVLICGPTTRAEAGDLGASITITQEATR
jgi:hypothetical protein